MAQVMAYWQYPSKGSGYHSYIHKEYGRLSANFGSTSYDWDNMLTDYFYGETAAQKNAVATLMYHCGVSTEMQYDVSDKGGSGTYVLKTNGETGTDNAEYAMENYFDYLIEKSGIKGVTISEKEWLKLLKNDLDNARPVLYAGSGNDGGHCFVCDGYDSEDYFHFNWGWGGYADGYFRLNALEPESGGAGGGDYTFNYRQKALFGLQPAHPSSDEDEMANIKLYSKISSPDSVRFFKDFKSSVDIANFNKTKDVKCTFAAVLFDSESAFYDYIDSIPQKTLPAYNYFTYETTYKGQASFMPGNYYLAYFYRTNDKGWTLIENDTIKSVKPLCVWYYDGIEVYSDFEITSGEFRQDTDVELQVKIANVTGKAFKGDIRIGLGDLQDGSWVQNIEVLNDVTISDQRYKSLSFKGHINADPGTYILQAAYRNEGDTQWYYAGGYYFPNPVRTVVKAKEVLPDRYEDNDNLMDAYILHPVFDEAGKCTFDIPDATLHTGSDVDYFALVLPEDGYYTVTPQSFDASMNKGYTVMTSSYYYISQSKEATLFDSNAAPFKAQGGTIVYFRIVPLLSGGKGSYGLKINVQRGEADNDAITVRYLAPDSWDAVYLWAWTEDGDLFAKWPGVALKKEQGGYYSYTFEEGVRGVNVIFSNGNGVQTMDLEEVINESVCMTFDGENLPAKRIECAESVTVRYLDTENWERVYLWAWTEDGDIFSKWPGQILFKGEDGYYSYTFGAGVRGINVIFSNGDGVQTMDLEEVINESVCLTFGGAGNPAKFIDCEGNGGITPVPTAETESLRIADGMVYSKGSIRIYTVSGELVRSATDKARLTDLPVGIYIIRTNEQAVKYIR